MKIRNWTLHVAIISLALVGICSSGQATLIGTYVDADASNVTPGSALATTWNAVDGKWAVTTDVGGEGGNSFLADNYHAGYGTGEDAPEIMLSVDGLAQGTYNIRLVYMVRSDGWYCQIQAGIDGLTSLQAYDNDSGEATGNSWDGIWQGRQVLLGTIENTTGFTVRVDDMGITSASGGYNWSIFDGVTYELVPEPATMGLLVAGGVLGLVRRRN